MTAMLRSVLDFIYGIIGNYGWSIAIFTILIRVVLLPLDIKNKKGMIKMQKMQPKTKQRTRSALQMKRTPPRLLMANRLKSPLLTMQPLPKLILPSLRKPVLKKPKSL